MNRRDIAVRLIGGALALIVLAWFAYANAGERVDVDFLLFTLRDVSLPTILYGAVIVGMLVILGVGFRADLRLRRHLGGRDLKGLTEGDSARGTRAALSGDEAEVGGKRSRT